MEKAWRARISDLHGRIQRGGISSATVEASLDPEIRWEETTIGDRGAGRQSSAARGREGAQPDLGEDFLGFSYGFRRGAVNRGPRWFRGALDALSVGMRARR